MKTCFLILFSLSVNFLLAQNNVFSDSLMRHTEVILLGEQTHRDGAVFDKKVQLIKELHEKHGFNLLVFESGFYDNYKALLLLEGNKEDISIYRQTIYPMWSAMNALKELREYVKTHPKLKILGFDSQEGGLFKEYFLDDFKEMCRQNNIEFSTDTYSLIEKTIVLEDVEAYAGNSKDSFFLYTEINKVIAQINLVPDKNDHTEFLIQTFKSAFSNMDFVLKQLQEEDIKIQNPRDKQMAENFIFLRNKYPQEKIIGWGASYHFANKLSEFQYNNTTEKYITKQYVLQDSIIGYTHETLTDEIAAIKELKYAKPMGEILKKEYGDALFSLGFSSFEGNYGGLLDNPFPVLEPPKNSLEYRLHKGGVKEKLILFTNNNEHYYASPFGYIPILANWSKVLDGIYFINTMYPPTFSEYNLNDAEFVINQNSNFYSGRIFDEDNRTPLGYADVYYKGNTISSVSTVDGRFTVLKGNAKSGYLVFSAMGYITDSIKINAIATANNLNVYLKKAKSEIVLDEAVISTKYKPLTAEEIIKKAKENISINYVQTPYNQDFFFRVRSYNEKDSLRFNEEALIKTFNSKGINGANVVENRFYGEIQEFRNTTDNYSKKNYNSIGHLWVLLNRDVILSKTNVLYRSGSYDLFKKGILNYQGRNVYQIDFVNNSPGSYSTGYGYPAPDSSRGTIFIDRETYAVLRYEHFINRAKYKPKRKNYYLKQFHKIVQTYKQVNGKYFLNLLEESLMSETYSLEDNFLRSSLGLYQLVSNTIETRNVKQLKRPISDLMLGFEIRENTVFWDELGEELDVKYQKLVFDN